MCVYLLAEAFGTISTNLMNRVAQKFIFGLRNRVYHKLQVRASAIFSASAPAI
jgi:hypothetical protein